MLAGIATWEMSGESERDTDMAQNRRNFIKKFGVTLGSLIVSGALPGCGPKQDGEWPDKESHVGQQNESSPIPRAPQWEQLRQCWLNLNNQNARSILGGSSFEAALRQGRDPFKAATDSRANKHRALLDALVAAGQLQGPVAKHMQIAFEEAAYHIARSTATCYIMLPIEYAPRKDLLQQAEVLSKISGDLDPATAARAQAAIAQDVAFFEIFKAGNGSYDRPFADSHKAGNLQASTEALEAARLLTQLFLERSD